MKRKKYFEEVLRLQNQSYRRTVPTAPPLRRAVKGSVREEQQKGPCQTPTCTRRETMSNQGNYAAAQQSGIRSMESNHKQLVVLRCKLVIVGEAAVGKTALTQVFTSGGPTFPKNYLMVSRFGPLPPPLTLRRHGALWNSCGPLDLPFVNGTDCGCRILREAGAHP